MSSTDLPTLTIDVAARRGERRVAGGLFGSLLVAISLWDLAGIPLFVIGTGVLFGVAAGIAWLGWLGGRHRWTRIVCQPDGRWLLCEAGGRRIESDLSAATRVSPYAMWLRWGAAKSRPLLLMSGDITEADFRRLVVRLRLAAPTPQGRM